MTESVLNQALKTIKKTPLPIPSTDQASEAFEMLVSAWKECTIVSEQEQSKREAIKAYRDVNVKTIEANTALLREYLEKSFEERAYSIKEMFKRLDEGLATGNNDIATAAMSAIIDITRQSPLAGARELIANIYDPNIKSIEI